MNTLTTLLTMAAAFIFGLLIVFNFRSSFPIAVQVEAGQVATASGVGIDPAQHRVATFQMW